ncbi:30S ribosomal protein S9 [Candidatus Campbellbacteria bacterium CG11_big_fil_rev_8_21_14_0_20_44_21]|uniref:Small ribosomal subunit protein uS9 n=1 Tax=Candidatus Campbellbacteria bacterium CG22_combo_CG10-13_8_21_14_all_43_18 TaxID=1974530 RepID=A0A2H0DXM8_9BACT|nr:MAG: 30S ribosomal protein S9 [Candidatus Campbellbacteria bacterium CG22_combo_CG10-13_8_21_14_all_43_18]PIR24443.1 MAG: 30S ribosomal protein S9 [Candidatus Campbellbacteria bacterium CG11_big_fil_rev_8_21_14_0_20_44_21]
MAKTEKKKKYFEAVGRRKKSVARVRLVESSKNNFVADGRKLEDLFKTESLQKIVKEALEKSGAKFDVSVLLSGGGLKSQAEAARLGISRALVKFQAELRTELKKAGFLKRDPRIKERKKFGLKKARKAPQWSKR